MLLGGQDGATASTAPQGSFYYIDMDYVGSTNSGMYNWDFTCQSYSCVNSGSVSFPVNLIFANNATISSVKSGIGFDTSGSTKYGWMVDGSVSPYLIQDDDGGKKNCSNSSFPFNSCKSKCVQHYRVYGNPTYDNNYDMTWGYWVYGTTHDDCFEGTDDSYFGYGEDTEAIIARQARDRGWTVYEDATYLYNPAYECQDEPDGPHCLINDGYATVIAVP